jgi:hypothetical protein
MTVSTWKGFRLEKDPQIQVFDRFTSPPLPGTVWATWGIPKMHQEGFPAAVPASNVTPLRFGHPFKEAFPSDTSPLGKLIDASDTM